MCLSFSIFKHPSPPYHTYSHLFLLMSSLPQRFSSTLFLYLVPFFYPVDNVSAHLLLPIRVTYLFSHSSHFCTYFTRGMRCKDLPSTKPKPLRGSSLQPASFLRHGRISPHCSSPPPYYGLSSFLLLLHARQSSSTFNLIISAVWFARPNEAVVLAAL